MKLWVTRTTINFPFFFGNSFTANDCKYWPLHIEYVGICRFCWMGRRTGMANIGRKLFAFPLFIGFSSILLIIS